MDAPASSGRRVRTGLFEIDFGSIEVHKEGRRIPLQEQPFRVLAVLLDRPGEVITREELQARLWPTDTFVGFDEGINTAMRKLRVVFGDSADNPRFIETIPRRGYRFIAPVQDAAAEPAPLSDRVPLPDASELPRARHLKVPWLVMALFAAALLVVLASVTYLRRSHPPAISSAQNKVMLAVLPFQNAGSDGNTDFLRLALPDEIATTLSYVPSFSIRPFATTSKYNGPNVDLQQAGREMRVTSIVTGHYLTEGNHLEITLEAVDVANNRTVWRQTINVTTSDRIAMREQVTSRVRQGLVPMLGGSSASGEAGTRPTSEEAYDLYLRSIAVPHDVAPNKDAIAMLEHALAIDPSYAPAWEALGLRYYYDATFGDGGEPMLKRSVSATERALTLDPNLIDAAARLIVNRTERGEVANAYAEALALVKRRPDSARAHFALGFVLRYAGSLEESAHECDSALALDRGSYQLRSCSWSFMQLDRPERAMEFVRLDAGSEWAARQTAFILMGQGKLAEARQTIQRTSDAPLMGRDLFQACLDPQQTSQLRRAAQRVETAALAGADPEPRYNFGAMLSYCGQKDTALRLLRSAVENNYCASASLRTDPLLVKFRGTPEFSESLSAAKTCQRRFLAQNDQILH